MNKQTVRDTSVDNKQILVRVDYNVPLSSKGKILDDYRIRASLPTIQYLLERGCTVRLISHLGRPEPGQQLGPQDSLRAVAIHLQELLAEKVDFRTDIEDASPSQQRVILYENLRSWAGEKAKSEAFARTLARLGELFVQDAFGNAHRDDASMVAITKLLPSYAGFLLQKEVDTITRAMQEPDQPLVAIMGGAKIADKIELIDEFASIAHTIVIGGAMANTFLRDQHFGGHDLGISVFEEGEEATLAKLNKDFQKKKTKVVLPDKDVGVGLSVDDDDRRDIAIDMIGRHDMVLDFGPRSLQAVKKVLQEAKTVIWNGPLGYIENPVFAHGSVTIAQYLASLSAQVIIGGGDTAEFIHQAGLAESFTHVSTGGGASLELMSGQKLPAVEALLDK